MNCMFYFNGITFKSIFMKKIILISVIIFAFCSCASDDAGFKQMTKKEIMESWAWKIFIFTDEGEIMPVGKVKNDFENTIKDKSIFVEDIWKMYNNEDLFLNNQKVAFKDPIVNANFAESKTKK
jgi:hypothetical protein